MLPESGCCVALGFGECARSKAIRLVRTAWHCMALHCTALATRQQRQASAPRHGVTVQEEIPLCPSFVWKHLKQVSHVLSILCNHDERVTEKSLCLSSSSTGTATLGGLARRTRRSVNITSLFLGHHQRPPSAVDRSRGNARCSSRLRVRKQRLAATHSDKLTLATFHPDLLEWLSRTSACIKANEQLAAALLTGRPRGRDGSIRGEVSVVALFRAPRLSSQPGRLLAGAIRPRPGVDSPASPASPTPHYSIVLVAFSSSRAFPRPPPPHASHAISADRGQTPRSRASSPLPSPGSAHATVGSAG